MEHDDYTHICNMDLFFCVPCKSPLRISLERRLFCVWHQNTAPLPHDFYCQLPRNTPGQSFSYSARLSCSRVYPISGNTQSVSAIAGSLNHIVYGLQDPHSSWPTSFGSIIINSLLFQESHCRSNVSMQTSVSVHPRTDYPWTYPKFYLAELRRTGKLI